VGGLAWAMRRGARSRAGAAPNLPGYAVNLLVLAAISRAAWHVIRGQATGNAVVSDLSEFLVVIELVKLFDRKTARDDVQLLALTLFVTIGAVLTANSLMVGLLILVYTPLITAAAMALQVDIGLRRLARTPGAPAGADAPGRAGHFRGTVGAAVAGSLVFAGLAFVLLPRGLGRNTLGAFGKVSPGATVGFTDQVKLGQDGFLRPNDSTPVMDVGVFNENGNVGATQFRQLYLRGSVSNVYESGTWKSLAPPSEPDGALMPEPSFSVPNRSWGLTVGTAAYRQVVTLRSGAQGPAYLFMMWRPTSLEWDTPDDVRLESDTLVFRRGSVGSGASQFRYTVHSLIDGPGPPARPGDAPLPAAWVPPTFRTGRIHDEAVRILRERGVPLDHARRQFHQNRTAAAAFQAYLRDVASYTLVMEAPPEKRDPIEYFMFDRKKGHCEYFASALVAMCQSVGIPARMALGYLATEYNEVSGQFVVRASNAHAWAEVEIEPGRWVTFDPSPPGDIELIHARGTGVLARLKRAYEAMDFAWNSLVVSFDEQRRSSLLGSGIDMRWLGERLGGLARRVDNAVNEVSGGVAGQHRRSSGWTYGVLGVVVAGGAGFALRRVAGRLLGRRARRVRGLGGHDRLASDLHRGLLRALRRAGAPKPVSRPALAHVHELAASRPALGRAAVAAAEAVYGSRFAGLVLTRERWRELARALDDVAGAG
jgi:hypothetical protein